MSQDHLDLFEEASAWMKSTRYRLDEDVPGLLGWLTSAVNAHLERAAQAPAAVPLTDEQIVEIYTRWNDTPGSSHADLMRAVERAHGITAAKEKP